MPAGAGTGRSTGTIPIEELRQILRDKLGAECDTDALVDSFLQQEEELEKADEKERREKDKSWELNLIMDSANDCMEKLYEEYDIPLEHMLPFYTSGNTIAPKTVRLLQKVLAFGDSLLEGKPYKELAAVSVMQRGTWLVSASNHFYGDLRDTDWERIFSNLEKDPDSFARYYSLFCIELGSWSVRNAVTALVVNDELYAYVRSLPPMEEE